VDHDEDYSISENTWNIHYPDLEFNVEGKIGSGNFAKVLRANYFGTPVAVKKILEPGGDMEKYVDRELALLKNLRHPNIVQFIGVCKHKDEIFIVTEYCSKGNLKSLLYGKPEVSLSWRRRVRMATDIARGLVYLNSRKFIHRDLKSDNCLVDDDGKLKLCDFGMARSTKRNEAPKVMTICGTDEWMAPEVMLGDPYDEKADVYSTGIVLTELITRKKPLMRYPEDNFCYPVAELRKIVPSDCPLGFSELALECVKQDPIERPEFKEVLDRLNNLEKDASSRETRKSHRKDSLKDSSYKASSREQSREHKKERKGSSEKDRKGSAEKKREEKREERRDEKSDEQREKDEKKRTR